jgi:hypothetical protein
LDVTRKEWQGVEGLGDQRGARDDAPYGVVGHRKLFLQLQPQPRSFKLFEQFTYFRTCEAQDHDLEMYTRYVPPKKNNRRNQLNDSDTPVEPPPTTAIPPTSTPPATKHDASSTYARYVPSKSKPQSVAAPLVLNSELQPRKKRRKIEETLFAREQDVSCKIAGRQLLKLTERSLGFG